LLNLKTDEEKLLLYENERKCHFEKQAFAAQKLSSASSDKGSDNLKKKKSHTESQRYASDNYYQLMHLQCGCELNCVGTTNHIEGKNIRKQVDMLPTDDENYCLSSAASNGLMTSDDDSSTESHSISGKSIDQQMLLAKRIGMNTLLLEAYRKNSETKEVNFEFSIANKRVCETGFLMIAGLIYRKGGYFK